MLGALVAFPLGADPQFALRVDPVLVIPYGNPSGLVKDGQDLDLYSTGYGVDVIGDATFFGFLSPFVSVSANSIPLNGVTGSSLSTQQLGLGVSGRLFPIPRVITTAGFNFGLANTSLADSTKGSTVSGTASFWKVTSEAGYRFTPDFSLSGLLGYMEILGTARPIFKGFTAGLRLNIGLDQFTGGNAGVSLDVVDQKRLFPITYYKSDRIPIASVRVLNTDAAEIRNVRVTFSAGNYTSRPAVCGEFPILQHGESVVVPVYANFNDKVLGFTETTKVQGELRVDYQILDAHTNVTKAVTVEFHNRNSATWEDPKVAGAFVSPQDPTMLELSKYIAGLVRVHTIPEIDKSLQYGMGIFEGLRVYGLVWAPDPALPYSQASRDPRQVSYIQFPSQTLSYKSGDSDALALALAEALESVAVPAAIVPLPEDVLVAFPLEMTERQARASFSNVDLLVFDSGTVWVPLRVSLIRDGFLRAWQAGAELWKAHPGAPFVKVEEAWKDFSAIPVTVADFNPVKPSEEAVTKGFGTVLQRFAQAESEPKLQRILAGITGEPTGSQHNSLGIVYAQYGFYEKAKEQFQKAVDANYTQATINLANVAFLEKDYATAADGFEKARQSNPTNKNVLLGLARARYELGDYAATNELYLKVKALDPVLAERFSYLSAQIDPATPPVAASPASGG